MKLDRLSLLAAILCLSQQDIIHGGVVHVSGETLGQGIAVSRGSDCFILTPAHVLGSDLEATLTDSRAEVVHATLLRSFGEVVDLAILRAGQNSESCSSEFADAVLHVNDLLETEVEGYVRQRDASGALRTDAVRILRSTYQWVFVALVDKAEVLSQGASGSALYVDREIVGMLVTVSHNGQQGKFLRSDFIWPMLGQLLNPTIQDCNPTCESKLNKFVVVDVEEYELHMNSNEIESIVESIYRLPVDWPAPPYLHVVEKNITHHYKRPTLDGESEETMITGPYYSAGLAEGSGRGDVDVRISMPLTGLGEGHGSYRRNEYFYTLELVSAEDIPSLILRIKRMGQ